MRVAIVGNGVAGIEAALAIRRKEPSWEVAIVSEESDHFFSRTALMYVLCGQLSPQQIEPYERDLYERMRFTRVRARATALDPSRKALVLAGRDPLPYDKLILACGSRPRPSPWGLPRGAGHFVTLQDLEWLEREMHGGPGRGGRAPNADAHPDIAGSPYARREALRDRRGTPPQHPVVIGGGLIGIEVVETMLAAGMRPRFIFREDWFWPVSLDPEEARFIAERLQEHGVDVELCTNVIRFEVDPDGNIQGVLTDCGAHRADLLVIAIGVEPNTQWLAGSGVSLDQEGGIVVGPDLSTSVPDVFAAGDCTSVVWCIGCQRPEQLWYTARDQGRVAARAILGEQVSYDRGTWYNSAKLMDVEYTTVGLVNQPGDRNWSWEERGRVRSRVRIVHDDAHTVLGMNLFGRRWDDAILRRWIEEKRALRWVVDHLPEASFDTEMVPPLRIPREARP